MPLLKSHKNDKHAEPEELRHGHATTNLNDPDYSRSSGAGVPTSVPTGMHSGSGATGTYPAHEPGYTTGATGLGQEPYTTGTHQNPTSGMGYSSGDPYSSAGVGHDNFNAGTGNIPPTHALHAGQATAGERHGSGGSGITGKVEKAVGTMIGSHSLKAKGMEKEKEAQALKMQSSELAEAERLEREAMMRRERAVGHGAHPDMGKLGGGGTGNVQ
ncbi:hypothetical protein K435DRAFT_790771 [Dendrothele bispora CBS 962.96]|uniref:Uncharacterized protein n=1 Tax=Dendrothele bispora (strain CBS 962.96) TaxID=1314807 RepID=A0A4S8MPR2_DENBC|nr:hypothetical protein K435DRAFT_790771 [Dendrothele bispora CBS 962.96]